MKNNKIKINISKIIFFCLSMISGLALASNNVKHSKPIKIGVIVPLQHSAMDEIVEGLKEKLKPYLNEKDEITVINANGDKILERQIIDQMKITGVDYFMPISTSTSLTTISLIKDKPIIAIAAEMDHNILSQKDKKRVVIISDKIHVSHPLDFLKKYVPKIKKIGFIYTNNEKIYPEIEEAKRYCKKNGLEIKLAKASNITEVYQFAASLISKVDAIVLLKDNMVVSCISGLATIAKKYKKLILSMDDGSVKGGAHIGIGVPEREIGVEAANSLITILNNEGNNPFRTIHLRKLFIFYNKSAFSKQDLISLQTLEKASRELKYEISEIGP